MPYLPNRRFRPGGNYPTRTPNYRAPRTQYEGFGTVSGSGAPGGDFDFKNWLQGLFGGGGQPPPPAQQSPPKPKTQFSGGRAATTPAVGFTGASQVEAPPGPGGLGAGGFQGSEGIPGLSRQDTPIPQQFQAPDPRQPGGILAQIWGPQIDFLRNFAQTGVGQSVRGFFEPEPGSTLSQPGGDQLFGQTIEGQSNPLAAIVDAVTNFQLPGTQGLVGTQAAQGRQVRGQATPGTTRVTGPLDEFFAAQLGMTVDEYNEQRRALEATGAMESPVTLDLFWENFWDTVGEAVEPKYQVGDPVGTSFDGFGGGGGGFGGFGGFPGFGGFDPSDPRFWLDAVRWLI